MNADLIVGKDERVKLSKDIAVLMGNINMENQKKIMEGMVDVARETNNNIYIFTNHSGRQESKESVQRSFQIMELPDFEYFDGVIIALNTIRYSPTASFVMDKIRASKIPAITLDRKVDGYGGLQCSSYDAQYKIIEHMIREHGCRDIAYIRGPVGYEEAELRFRGYQDALKDNGIAFCEEKILDGVFSVDCGVQAAKKLYRSGKLPEVLACASDNMAFGAMEYFQSVGVHIPEDIRLVGFDNSDRAEYSTPSITSIDKSPYELGRKAVCEILETIEGKEPVFQVIPSAPVYRVSCGCKEHECIDVERLKQKYTQRDLCAMRLSDLLNTTLIEFSGLQKPEDILPIMEKSLKRLGLKSFYLCLCEREKVYTLPECNMGNNFEELQSNTDYTEHMELPLAYEDGEITRYPSFPKGMVLPKQIRETDRKTGGNYYVITPIYFQNCCYGYCVSGNDKLTLKNNLYYLWLMNIGVAYENIRKWMLLQDAIVRLNNVWSYDALTQLYNRAGFFYEAKTILEILKLQDSKIFVLFSDVDGLKKINDTQGHEAGDVLIKTMADCCKENLTNDMLAMRYGGDEFVIFGSYEDEREIAHLIQSIKDSIERRNAAGKYSFVLSASIGVSKYRACEVNELSELIELADAKMYEEKRQKREARKRLAKKRESSADQKS